MGKKTDSENKASKRKIGWAGEIILSLIACAATVIAYVIGTYTGGALYMLANQFWPLIWLCVYLGLKRKYYNSNKSGI